MEKKIYLTHSGLFHADEVAGYAVARMANVVSGFLRTSIQEAEKLFAENPQDYLVADILREYDAPYFKFDHHQQNPKTTPELYRPNGVPKATAGLLWLNFGKWIIREEFPEKDLYFAMDVARRVDKLLFEQLDANDASPDWYVEGYANGESVRVTTLSHLISGFNSEDIRDEAAQDQGFEKAAFFFSGILDRAIQDAVAYAKALQEFEGNTTYDNTTRTITCLDQIRGWQEMAAEVFPDALYLFGKSSFPDNENPFSLIAVPVNPARRELKRPIERPDGWKKFIHAGKFIAAVASWEEAVQLISVQK